MWPPGYSHRAIFNLNAVKYLYSVVLNAYKLIGYLVGTLSIIEKVKNKYQKNMD